LSKHGLKNQLPLFSENRIRQLLISRNLLFSDPRETLLARITTSDLRLSKAENTNTCIFLKTL
ncbi:MAG: hypothetical protein ABGX43_08945, partial [Nitrospinaceae bacterium]